MEDLPRIIFEKYPEKAVLLELNEVNSSVRVISENERKNLATAVANKISICQYYIRDTRLYEIYLCLKYCQYKKICGTEKINRRIAETDFFVSCMCFDSFDIY